MQKFVEFFTNSLMQAKERKIILIAGPTASGKTGLALQIAEHYKCPILSVDSRQCFRELNIGVAKPSEKDLQKIHHYFINSHSIHDEVNASIFESLALEWVNEIFKSHRTAVMVGGTGLYIKSFCEGLDEIPAVPESIRREIEMQYEKLGLGWLKDQIRESDPVFFEKGEIQNPRRLMRALEVWMFTGRSLHSFRSSMPKKRDFKIEKFGISLSKEILHSNISHRVDQMMNNGLLQEVKDLLPFRSLNALQTVGYSELFSFLDGDYPLEHAVERIKKNTRQYAKRQLTWFRKDPDICWIELTDIEKIIKS
ncbi:MAG: tRNA (adenosine(37)-N6)-dimethylallyltransferase MiaA [Chitinophagales bacterium]